LAVVRRAPARGSGPASRDASNAGPRHRDPARHHVHPSGSALYRHDARPAARLGRRAGPHYPAAALSADDGGRAGSGDQRAAGSGTALNGRVVILGASGNALDILDIIDALGAPWEAAGVLDDGCDKGSEFGGLPILGKLAEAAALADVVFVNGIASERTHRRKLG